MASFPPRPRAEVFQPHPASRPREAPLDERTKSEVAGLIERIRRERGEADLAHAEVMLAYLKVLLVLATRLKSPNAAARGAGPDLRHPVLAELRDLIEQNYRAWP